MTMASAAKSSLVSSDDGAFWVSRSWRATQFKAVNRHEADVAYPEPEIPPLPWN